MQKEDLSIHDAVLENRQDIVLKLVQSHGKQILDHTDHDGYSALMISCIKSNLDMATLLLEQGASVSKRSKIGNTAFFYACGAGNLNLVKRLHEFGADSHGCNSNGDTALLFSVVGNRLDVVEWLLNEEHVDVNASNHLGMTALMCAASNNYHQCVKLLLDHSADISRKNKLMKTALDLATCQPSLDLLKARWVELDKAAKIASAHLTLNDKKKHKKKKKVNMLAQAHPEQRQPAENKMYTIYSEQEEEPEKEKNSKLQNYFSQMDSQVQDLDLSLEDFLGVNLISLSMSQLCALETLHYKLIQQISEVKIEKIREQERIKYEEHEALQKDLKKLQPKK